MPRPAQPFSVATADASEAPMLDALGHVTRCVAADARERQGEPLPRSHNPQLIALEAWTAPGWIRETEWYVRPQDSRAGGRIGSGRTRAEAVAALLEQLDGEGR